MYVHVCVHIIFILECICVHMRWQHAARVVARNVHQILHHM